MDQYERHKCCKGGEYELFRHIPSLSGLNFKVNLIKKIGNAKISNFIIYTCNSQLKIKIEKYCL